MFSFVIGWIITSLLAATTMYYIGVGLHKLSPKFEPMPWKFCIIFSLICQLVFAIIF